MPQAKNARFCKAEIPPPSGLKKEPPSRFFDLAHLWTMPIIHQTGDVTKSAVLLLLACENQTNVLVGQIDSWVKLVKTFAGFWCFQSRLSIFQDLLKAKSKSRQSSNCQWADELLVALGTSICDLWFRLWGKSNVTILKISERFTQFIDLIYERNLITGFLSWKPFFAITIII